MKHPKISIIIPVYNTENWLKECIDSIILQSFREWECILINDGSSDTSGIICEQYASSHDNIHVIHQNNQGVTRARAHGIQVACSEYITFVDSDDTLPLDALNILYNNVVSGVDIVEGSLSGNGSLELQTAKEYRHRLFNGEKCILGPVGKLFKRCLLTDFVFDIPSCITYAEDWLMNVRVSFNMIGSIKFIPDKVYNYRSNRAASATSSFVATVPYQREMYSQLKRSCLKTDEDINYFIAKRTLLCFTDSILWHFRLSSEEKLFRKQLIEEQRYYKVKLSNLRNLLLRANNPLLRILLAIIFYSKQRFRKSS